MRIGFDLTPLCTPRSGVGTYTINLYESLARRADDELLPLAHRPLHGDVQSVNHRHGFQLNKTLWMQAILPREAARLRTEVCHFTNSVGPLYLPCPMVLTIHDMTLWLLPELHRKRRHLAMRPIIPLAVRRASAIIAVSEATKRDMTRILGVPGHKVRVIYEAAAPYFRPLMPGAELEGFRQNAELPERFVLHVGTIDPRKNLVRLLEAFALARKNGAHSHSLVLIGQRGWRDGAVFTAIERLGLGEAVRFLGYVPTDVLVALYNLADVLAFPSLYEGFGLTMVEAMACGTPVVASPNGALREIAGEAVEFVEPTNVESIAAGLTRVLTDSSRRAELREKGLRRAARFSWARTAEETRQLYSEVAANREPSWGVQASR
jgi:glycosyltransferase involved in cell wall biosynthesis